MASPTRGRTDQASAAAPASRWLRYGALITLLFAGVAQCWRYRHFIYPDGIQYLDVARLFAASGPARLINGTWSPLYPALIGVGIRLLHPTIYWMYPVVQLVNVIDFTVALLAFDFFLAALLDARQRQPARAGAVFLSADAVRLIACAIFAVSVLYVLNVRTMSPDMIVAASVLTVSGLLLQPRRRARSIAIGAVLAVGYLAKAVMFPVSLIYLAAWPVLERGAAARRHALVAAATFLVVSSPWLTALSIAKGRPTFGDIGGFMYATFVNHAPAYWMGAPPFPGQPVHSARQIAQHPDAFSTEWQVPVSYATFFDLAYWNEGLKPALRMNDQLRAFARTAGELADIGRTGYLLLGPVLILLVAADRGWARAMWSYRLIWAPAVAAIAMYMIVHIEGRMIAGQLQLLLTVTVAATAFPPGRVRLVQRAATAAALAAALVTAGPVAAGAVRHAVGDLRHGEGREPSADWRVAQALAAHGVAPGDRIAVIGNTVDVSWAQLAAASIVAEVPVDQLPAYLAADAPRQSRVLDAFAQLGVRTVVARSTAPAFDASPWTRLPDGEFAVRAIGARR